MPAERSPSNFGLWSSPITARNISQGIGLSNSQWDSDGERLVWTESRGDRTVLVSTDLSGNAPRDLSDDLSVRAKLGYGGGDFTISGGRVVFVSGGRLYIQDVRGGKPTAITPAWGDVASPEITPNGKWVLYVFSSDRTDVLAVTDVENRCWPQKVVEGHDFFMQPVFNRAGSRGGDFAAWVAWDHPQMPWDGSKLYLAEVHEPSSGPPFFKHEQMLAGAENVAVMQPEFSPDGRYLSYLSDQSGWHNLYLYDLKSKQTRQLTKEKSAQLGSPAWVQGLRTYGWSHDSRSIVCIRNERGIGSLWRFKTSDGAGARLEGLDEYTDFLQPAMNPKRAAFSVVASSGTQPARLLVVEFNESRKGDGNGKPIAPLIIKRANSENTPSKTLVSAEPVSWKANGQTIHGLLYAPKISASPRSKILPPAIVRVHGGPTSQARAGYTGDTQYFATRGYMVLDINYRGSTGYGRPYMEALRGQWGVADVEDVIGAAGFLVKSKLADPSRLVILGGSAGGYTVLLALALHPHVFRAGVCLYGVSDLFGLASDTHKMEERYLDSLVGPLPDAAELYRRRSPRFHADTIVDPLAIFHGSIDEVVPLSQADCIVASLKRRNVPHEFHVYEGEGHGWRKKETVEKYYGAVEKFLKKFVLYA